MTLLDLTLPEHAYLFGFAQADGSLRAGTRGRGSLAIELSAVDAEHLERLAAVIPVKTTITRRQRTTNFKADHESATLRVFDAGFRAELVALGFPVGRKSRIIAPPTCAFSQRDYFRGIVDADGSLGLAANGCPFISLCTTSGPMAAALTELIDEVTGQRKRVRPNRRDDAYNIMCWREAAQKLASELYYDGALALPRKAARARAVLAWRRPADCRPAPPRRRWTPAEDRVVATFSVVEAIEILGRTENSVRVRRQRLKQVRVAA